MNAAPIIEIEKLHIKFGTNVVHKDITFSVQAGESLVILGPSGAGKTLILKSIVALLRPSSGRVRVLDHDLHSMNEDELHAVRKNIGMLFQGAALFDSLSVFDNIAYPLREYGAVSEEEMPDVIADRLELVGLPGIEDKFPSQLSGGQKKRVGLARAMASSPKIILFDEPTTGLDPTATRLIDELIIKLKSDYGITCLSVTHDIASARRISDRWLLLTDGIIVSDGPVEEVTRHDQQIIDFINGNWKKEISIT